MSNATDRNLATDASAFLFSAGDYAALRRELRAFDPNLLPSIRKLEKKGGL